MCARLLTREERREHGRLYRASEAAFDWILRRYERTLGWILRHQPALLVVTLLTIALNVYLFAVVPKGFFPQQDTGRLTGSIQAAQDISPQAMRQKLTQVVDIIQRDPAVETSPPSRAVAAARRPTRRACSSA